MPRSKKPRKYRVGEKVKTVHGDGVVQATRSWSESVGSMEEAEAEEFTRRVTSVHGPNAPDEWQNVFVGTDGRVVWHENYALTIIESRDV